MYKEFWPTHEWKECEYKIGLKNEQNETIFDQTSVANKFNSFFYSIASNLVNKLQVRAFDECKVDKYYKEMGVKSCDFKFSVVSETDILKNVGIVKCNKSNW